MNILSLFDGMSCGQIALNRAGINYETYYASEIDKHAIKVTQSNYPDTIQLGDVTKWREWDIDWSKIGLLMAGSPCQGFSFAGKQLAFDDPRSALFFVFVEIWRHIKSQNPNAYYLLENVKMKKEHELVISNYIGVHPIEINSALVSAQNRKRLYWTNIANEPYGFFGDMQCVIPQPKDKGILLCDVLESDVDEKYYLSEKMLAYFKNRAANYNQGKVNVREEEGKASCLTSSMASCDISDNFIKVDTNLKASKNQDKANCFTAGGNSGGLHSDMTLIGCIKFGRTEEAKQIRKENMAKGVDYTPHAKKEISGVDFEKMNTLTTASNKDNLVMQIPEATKKGFAEVEPGQCFDMTMPDSKTRRGRLMEDKSNCLTASNFDFLKYTEDYKIRRLTPIECERLQTAPDNYTKEASDTQRYRMLGNGWTVDVIVHILKYIKQTK